MPSVTDLWPGSDPAVMVVDTGQLRLAFVPGAGGRLLSIRAGSTEFLWRNPGYFDADLRVVRPKSQWPVLDGTMASWANLGGSKTWPAPQGWDGPGQWAGPPDAVLDSGAWTWAASPDYDARSITVSMTSPDDARSGLRVTRSFVIQAGSLSFTQRSTFTNITSRPLTWSLWEVCQVDTGSGVGCDPAVAGIDIGCGEPVAPVELVAAHGRIEVGPAAVRAGLGVRTVPIRAVVAKVGLPDADRFVAYRRPDGARLALEFTAVPDARYPDGGSRVELWMQCPLDAPLPEFGGLEPDAYLTELEVLSPAHVIAPGGSACMDVRWSVTPAC